MGPRSSTGTHASAHHCGGTSPHRIGATAYTYIVSRRFLCIWADVKPLESYPAYTSRLLDVEAPNMAVSGYGIDQAILKYRYHGVKLDPDMVVLGVYPSDDTRAALAFSAYAKPKVIYDPIRERLEVHDGHIRSPQEQLSILRREARWTSYIVAFFETAVARLFETSAKRQAYLAAMDRVVFELLAELKATLEKRGVRLLVVQTPDSTAFATVSTWERALVDPARNHLLNLYEELEIPYIDVMREFLRFASLQELYRHYFVTLPNGKRGHLSPQGNRQVAMLIAERLCKLDFKSDAWPTPLACDDLQLRSYANIRLAEWRAMDTSDTAVDLGRYGLPGTIRGDLKVEQEECRAKFCWAFDGHSSHVVVGSTPLLHLKTDFAIEAWV